MAKEKTNGTEAKEAKKKRGPSQQDLVKAAMDKQGDNFSTKEFAEKSGISYANVAWYKWNLETNDGHRPAREKKEATKKKSNKK